MANPIATLAARLKYDVDYTGLRQFEKSLQGLQKRIESSQGLVGAQQKLQRAQKTSVREFTRGTKQLAMTQSDYLNSIERARQALEKGHIEAAQFREIEKRNLNAINDLREKNFKAEQRRQRALQRAQGTYAGGKDPRQAGDHRLISALHSDTAIGALFGGFAAASSVQAYQEFVGIRQGLTAATGGVEQGREELQFMIDLSNRLGISIRSAADGYKNFVAASKNTSIAGEQTRQIFEGVMSYAKVLNLSADDTSGVMRALTQMLSKGKVSAEEMRQQFGDRMPGAAQAAARALGITVAEMWDLIEAGDLTGEELLPKLSIELRRMANEGGQLQEAMRNTGSAIQRFSNNVFLANVKFQEAGFDTGVRNLFNAMSDFIQGSDALWRILGSTAGFVANALRAPFEVLTDLAQAMGVAEDKAAELGISTNQMVAGFLALTKIGRRLLAIFVLLPYTLSAMSRAWNEGGIANWAIALGSAAATALIFKNRIIAIGKAARSVSQAVSSVTGGAASRGAGTASGSATRGTSPITSATVETKATMTESLRNNLERIGREVGRGAGGRLPVFGFGAGSVMSEEDFMNRANEIPRWNLLDRLRAYDQQQQGQGMVVNGDIRFEIQGQDGPQIADDVIRIINEQLIRPASMSEPKTER